MGKIKYKIGTKVKYIDQPGLFEIIGYYYGIDAPEYELKILESYIFPKTKVKAYIGQIVIGDSENMETILKYNLEHL